MQVVLDFETIKNLTARGIIGYVVMGMSSKRDKASLDELVINTKLSKEFVALCVEEAKLVQNLEFPGKKSRAVKKRADSDFTLPIWIDREAWEAFEEMRNRGGHPMTDRVRNMIVKKLGSEEFKRYSPEAVLNQSTINGWRDVFCLRTNGSSPQLVSKMKETEWRK